jgi:hypothetical protein
MTAGGETPEDLARTPWAHNGTMSAPAFRRSRSSAQDYIITLRACV